MTPAVRRRLASLAYALATAGVLLVCTLAPAQAADPPAAPAGLTALALDGRVELSWRAVPGATSYAVYRGTSPGAIDERLTPTGFNDTTFSDTTADNGTPYVYAVRALAGSAESVTGQTAAALPRNRSCSTGNAIVVENCFPGTTAWKMTRGTRAYEGGVEGFTTASSVNAGDSVDVKIEATPDAPYHIEIYRTGYYGGDQGRLVSVIPGLRGDWQSPCYREEDTTGIVDCSSWSVSATISTTEAWPSGVYLLQLVRDDNGLRNEIPLVVRDDGSHSDVLYQVPTTTYQAYNNFYGKALYDGLSQMPNTVAQAPRAVKVSFDRPYAQPTAGPDRYDWYTRADIPTVTWLEQQGYDTTYIADEDLHADGAQARDHDVLISGSHDEYWSQEMVDAALAARDAGTSLMFMGANAVYWKIRFEPGLFTGRPNRVQVTYKTVETGPPDPQGPTSTWRDPAGPNRPENELIGQMYVGQNIGQFFPLRVSAAEGRHRFWRYTPLAELAAGTSANVGAGIVGWEWDARVDNGREPPGVQTVASSPASGTLVQENGHSQSSGSATATTTLYRAASGALVFSSGTNHWARGLATNVDGAGEPNTRIQQATMNVLADSGARPTTRSGSLELDPVGPPAVTGTSPAAGAGQVVLTAPITATFDRELDPASVDDGDVTVTGSDGTAVPGGVALDNATRTLTFRPADALEPFTSYTVRVGTGLESWNGDAPAAAHTWTFSTGPGTPPVVTARTPAADATAVHTDTTVRARFDRRLDPATVTPGAFTLRPAAGGAAVAASVAYEAGERTAVLTPDAPLAQSTRYTAELSTAIEATDGTPMAAATSWSFTTGTNLQVTSRSPAPFAGGISPATAVRAGFSRAIDGATLTTATFRLAGPGGQAVPASVTYDATSRTATLVPSAPLALMTTYSASVSGVRAADGAPLDGVTWTFTTAATPPPSPVVTGVSPAAGAAEVYNGARVRATFDQPLDAVTVSPQSFTLTPDGGSPVLAAVAYDPATGRATLTPAAPLAIGVHYTATLSTAVRSTTGAPLAAPVSWSFTTARCPCSLMTTQTPQMSGLPVQDYRPGSGPFSYELGTRITVQEPTDLVALRYYRDPQETGTHVGRVWNASGTQLAQATYANETSAGWQRQRLATPLRLQPGQTYTVSVGLNAFYGKTEQGLAQPLSSGPLQSVAGPANGVFGQAAGQFPNSSWASSNYFVDAVVRLPASPVRTPAVTSVTPVDGATGTATGAAVTATFNLPLDGSTVSDASFTLEDEAGASVAAHVRYDDESQTATLTPDAPLETGAAYRARLTTAIRSDDETPMAAPVSWSFSTVPPAPPLVVSSSPASGASDISPLAGASATFSERLDPATIGASTFTLSGPGGSAVPATVTYDDATRTATLTPDAPLAASTTYTARVGTGVRSTRGVALPQPATWTFTTSACPCRLFADGEPAPANSGLETRNWRSGSGPWSLELGVKVRVTQPARLEAVRFLKDAAETGTHVGRVWRPDGTLLASTTFTGESASGWQQQALATPLTLVPGQTYVVSVGMNSYFGMTGAGLASERVSGPLRSVADGRNGVYADVAGQFPDISWNSSNYFVDTVVR